MIIKCSECGAEVSDKAETCPSCGHPVKKKLGCGAVVCVIAIAALVAVGFAACSGNIGKQPSRGQGSVVPATEQQDDNRDNVKVVSAKPGSNSIGDKLLYVTYRWTNNDNESRAFFVTHTAKAFQGGVELAKGTDVTKELYEDQNEVKPGKTQEFTKAYKLKGKKDVTIEIADWGFGSDEPFVEETIELK